MKKRSLFSALLAVMMVLSMMACIALPTTVSALSNTEIAALPLASTAAKNDGITAYKIDSVDELIAAASADFVGTVYKMAANSDSFASASNYIHEKFIDTGYARGDVSTYNTIYITADLDIAAWETATGKTFADEYDGFNANAKLYTTPSFVLDGLGHKITGYRDGFPLISGNFIGVVKNLTMVDSHVVAATTASGYKSPALVVKASEIGGVELENVHVNGCSVTTEYASTYNSGAGLLIATAYNAGRNLKMTNCTAYDSTLTSTVADACGVGFLVGVVGGNDFYANNCLVAKSTLKVGDPANNTYGNAFLFGLLNNGGQMKNIAIDNVAAVNNTFIAADADNVGIITTMANIKNVNLVTTNTYAVGNVWKTAVDAATSTPIAVLYNNGADLVNSHDATGVATDAGVTKVTLVRAATPSKGLTSIDNAWSSSNLTADVALALMNKNEAAAGATAYTDFALSATGITTAQTVPAVATFVMDGDTLYFAADSTGKVTVDAASKVALSAKSWTANGAPAAIDFDNLTIAADTVYTVAAHTSHIEAIPGDNANHKIVCDNCTDAAHNYTVACADVTTAGTPVAGDYFTPAQTAYTCVCGNTWTVDDANYAPESPITVNFDADSYNGTGAAVKVALGAKADANLNAYTATVTFDPAKLAYVDYSTAFNCVVDDTDKASGTVTIAFMQAAGQVLNTEAMTLNFQAVNIAADTTVDVNVTVTDAVVDTGSEVVRKMPLNTQAADSAAVLYVPAGPVPTFTAGDVDNDGYVDLLDAVLTIQYICGTIHTEQAATFEPWAANVDGDSTISVNDVTLLLKKSINMPVNLVASTVLPTVVAPNP